MMKRMLFVELVAVFLLAGCMVGHGRRGSAVVLVPALPTIVVLEAEPYYQHSGYFYYYRNNSWSYSSSRSGPWVELPRDRYPKEVRFKGRVEEKGGGDQKGRGEKGGQENRNRD